MVTLKILCRIYNIESPQLDAYAACITRLALSIVIGNHVTILFVNFFKLDVHISNLYIISKKKKMSLYTLVYIY